MSTPMPANPKLLQAVKDSIFEEIWNCDSPPEQVTQLKWVKGDNYWRPLVEGLTARDFQVLVDNRLDEETRNLVRAWRRLKELRAAAHPKTQETNS